MCLVKSIKMNNDTTTFSYDIFVGLEIVSDNARSHAPRQKTSAPRGRTPGIPQRGLTRWGSKEDLVSTIPKPPSRDCSPSPPPPPPTVNDNIPSTRHCQLQPPEPWSNRDTRIHRIRSRWNSQICRDQETMGKISLSPIIPQRCFEDNIKMPEMEGREDEKDPLSLFAQTEGILWKRTLQPPTDWNLPDENQLTTTLLSD